MMMEGYWGKSWVQGAIFGVFLVVLSMSQLFYRVNQRFNDGLYQNTSQTNPDICIIGIDGASIDELGSFPFDRQIFADLITLLRESDTPPLAIGVDVLFTGETNQTSDLALIEAVSGADEVVLACSGNYGLNLVVESETEVYLDYAHLNSMNYPFPALLEVANLGHINSSLDRDGILRKAVLTIESLEGEAISSLHLALYEIYCEKMGISEVKLPENQWYLPFSGKSGGYFDGYSLTKVLSGEIPTSVFQDKIVLIGPYTIGLQDHFYTAIDHTNVMYGVEYQANALDALIKQDFIQVLPVYFQNILLFVLVFFLFLVNRRRKLAWSGLISLLAGGIFVVFCEKIYDFGYLLDVFYVPLGIFLLYLLNIISSAVRARREKAKVTATFKRYVAPAVVEKILKEGVDSLKLGGSTMDVSVMFIDVRNFTPMSEKFPPEIVVDILNRFLNQMSETIMDHGGTLDKFIGDAIMCFWGAPLPSEDYVEQSVETSLAILEDIRPIIQEVEEKYQHSVSVGIGIQCGKAVVGNIGSHNRMDFTVIGDTVNTAARLESKAQGNTIHISHSVYEKVKNRVICQEIPGGLDLKGKEGLFRAYRVLRPTDTTSSSS